MKLSNLRNCHGVVLVFDVTNEESFEDLEIWIKKIKEFEKPLTFLIMANKIDLENERVITKEKGEEFAKKYNFPYYEVSAKKNIGIKEAIQKCAEDAFELYKFDRYKQNLKLEIKPQTKKNQRKKCIKN